MRLNVDMSGIDLALFDHITAKTMDERTPEECKEACTIKNEIIGRVMAAYDLEAKVMGVA